MGRSKYGRRYHGGNYRYATNIMKGLLRREYIKPYFPFNAKTTTHTSVPFHVPLETLAMTNGVAKIGVMNLSNLKDPFGDMNTTVAGAVVAASTWESNGHDTLDKIYSSYQVTSSNAGLQCQITDVASTNVQLGLACIPATFTTDPLALQNTEALINHPLVKMKKFGHAASTAKPTCTLHYPIMHRAFKRSMLHSRDSSNDEDNVNLWKNFDVGTAVAGEVFLHWYLYTTDSARDDTDMITSLGGTMSISQKVNLDKGVFGSTHNAKIASEYLPNVA